MASKHWTIEYLTYVLDQMNWNMNQLAEASGVAASTINRPLREKSWSYGLSSATVGKIHGATGIDPEPFMPSSMNEPKAMYMAQSSSHATDQTSAQAPMKLNEVRVSINGQVAQIVATVDLNGIKKLREKIDMIERLLSD